MSSLEGIEVFSVAVEAGSFAAAARKLRVTPSAVSRRVAQLEQELGVSLLSRTTRSLRLTDDGQAFHARCLRILEELQEARDDIAKVRRAPAGMLRVDAPIAFTRSVLGPRLPRFLERYPELRVALTLRDQRADPVAEGLDLLVRIGPLADSALLARRVGQSRFVFCASPAYVKKHGRPKSPSELRRHRCVGYWRDGAPDPFRFVSEGGVEVVDVDGQCHVNDADVARQLVLGGQGVGCFFDFLVDREISSRKLTPLLQEHAGAVWPIHVLYPKNRHLLPKVNAFVDFLLSVCNERGLSPKRGAAA
jgi:LysR family transcriptional regulator, regulator for bpeEF and oprC